MANLPHSGQTESMDALTVTREEFRQGMNKLLEFLAQGLGGVTGTYGTEDVDPLALILQGEPKLLAAAVPPADDESTRLASTAWVRLRSGLLPKSGGVLTGTVVDAVKAITTAFDLATANVWTAGAIAIPNPTNDTPGTGGLLVLSDAPTSWGSAFKFAGGAPPAPAAFPAVLPFYVQAAGEVLMGHVTEIG
jgi:hypothetical protein